ncbi:MAG: DUF362 domain-containing protein, partial [bacterium]
GENTLYFARLLIDIYKYVAPCLSIVDGIVGMEGNGPGNGVPKTFGFIALAEDCFALDLVAGSIIGLKSESNPILVEANNMGEKGACRDNIEVLGCLEEDLGIQGVHIPNRYPIGMTFKIPEFLRSWLKQYFTVKPQIETDKCSLCCTCQKQCPADGAIFIENNQVRMDTNACIRCFCCQEICPQGAIYVKTGFLLKGYQFLLNTRK